MSGRSGPFYRQSLLIPPELSTLAVCRRREARLMWRHNRPVCAGPRFRGTLCRNLRLRRPSDAGRGARAADRKSARGSTDRRHQTRRDMAPTRVMVTPSVNGIVSGETPAKIAHWVHSGGRLNLPTGAVVILCLCLPV